MNNPQPNPDPSARRIDSILAFTALGLAAASVACFFAIIIGTAVGMAQGDFLMGAWPLVSALPIYGLPLAFILIIALLIMSFIRKGRAAQR